jgi:thiol-disulfide isomerase/thioredoxin
MKTTQLTFVALCMLVSMTMQAQQKVVELPPSMHSNTTSVEIHRVTLDDTATVLDMDAFFRPGWWIKIASDSYLMADGKKYMIRSGEGIEIDSLFWMPPSGEASFKLVFDPLPENTKTFDFMEGDCADCFKIWGVDLVNERLSLPEIPEKYRQAYQPEPDLAVKWEKGKAIVSGQLLGYSPRYEMKPRLIYLNPITGQEDMASVTPADDGTFHAEIGIFSPAYLTLTYDSPQSDRFVFIAAPGQETNILVNLPEANRTRTRLHKESPGYGKKVMIAGYQSKLNDDLNHGDFSKTIYANDLMTAIAGMSFSEYYDYIIGKYRQAVADNNGQNVSPMAKKVANMQLAFEVNNFLMSAEGYLAQAYMQKNNVPWEEAMKEVGSLKKPDDFGNYLVELPYPYDDPDFLLVPNIPYYVGSFNYLRSPQEDQFGLFRYLAGSDKVKPEDSKIFSDFLERREVEEVIPDSLVRSVLSSYKDLQEKYVEETSGVSYLSKVWNTDDCFLFDLMTANKISRKMDDFYPLTDEQKAMISTFDPVMRDVLLDANLKLLAKIEENKKKTGYTVLDVPEVTNEELFAEMIKPFKGKTVLLDIWETWCGPCRAANKAMEPLKAQLANKEMVYLYLASESSPENSWRNMIPDLHGYHYRVNDLQSAFLREQLRSRGVPTYVVLNKEGNETFHAVGFPGEDTMKKELMKALGE